MVYTGALISRLLTYYYLFFNVYIYVSIDQPESSSCGWEVDCMFGGLGNVSTLTAALITPFDTEV